MTQQLTIRILPQIAHTEEALKRYLSQHLAIDIRTINAVRIIKRSIDARQRQVFINLTVDVFINETPDDDIYLKTTYPDVSTAKQAIVVGEGPCGLFAALRLIEQGIKPIVIERGKDVRQRKKDLALIKQNQTIDPESNYCFGEGGAGAYSDGKLMTRSKKRGSIQKILNVFCQHGASTAILADAHPHIGTDKLPRVIENMRKQIIASGGEVHFMTKMTQLLISANKIQGIQALRLTDNKQITILADAVILATGHSARDVYRYLASANVQIEPKGIAVGVRLEHPSQLIDQIQYHSPKGRGQYLPAAEYSFVTQAQQRGVYSFCMCPGGFVIPAATDNQQIVVNGMSPSDRAGQWSNSGMVVEIRPEDITDRTLNIEGATPIPNDPLAVMHFQENLEKACWQQGNMKQTAPAQRMADFVNNKLSYDLQRTSYAPGVVSSPLHFWLPPFITKRLQEGFRTFGKQRHGFLTNEALMIGVETRTSAPVRITRDPETLQHTTIQGLFPAGEGAGYAGGIVSAAIDGERAADMTTQYLNSIK